MDKVKKGKLAKRAKSFKEELIDILSNLRSPSNNTVHQASSKPKPLPITTTNGNGREPERELLCLIEDLPSCITLSQHFTNVINKNIIEVRFCFRRPVSVQKCSRIIPTSTRSGTL